MSQPSGIGIEMINVGKGDAILVELRDVNDGNLTLIIDGGCDEKDTEILPFLQQYHANNQKVVISTHSDNDHIGGLAKIISAVKPYSVIINDPREFQTEGALLARARNELSVDDRDTLRSALERIDEVNSSAKSAGSKILSKFASTAPIISWGQWNVYVVGPSINFFKEFWVNNGGLRDLYRCDDENIVESLTKVGKSILDDGVDTNGANNTSIMLLIEGPYHKSLFTGDAGMRAIREAHAIKDLSNLSILDVPHHGSRRNLDSELIKLLKPISSYISSPGTDKHPRRAVVKKLQETGSKVYSTCRIDSTSIYYNMNIPRPDYTNIEPWPKL